MDPKACIAIMIALVAAMASPFVAHAQGVTKDVTGYLMSAASAKDNGQTQEAKSFVDQAAMAAKTSADWRAVAESYRALGDDDRWSWALNRSSQRFGTRRRGAIGGFLPR